MLPGFLLPPQVGLSRLSASGCLSYLERIHQEAPAGMQRSMWGLKPSPAAAVAPAVPVSSLTQPATLRHQPLHDPDTAILRRSQTRRRQSDGLSSRSSEKRSAGWVTTGSTRLAVSQEIPNAMSAAHSPQKVTRSPPFRDERPWTASTAIETRIAIPQSA